MLMRLYPTFAEGHRRIPKPKPLEPSLVARRVEGPKSVLMADRALREGFEDFARKARSNEKDESSWWWRGVLMGAMAVTAVGAIVARS
ncbi:Hypp5463 [Branchiostoma lanceolatum]|uniref:Hypp5463 protein n=1 Tax=Branchiostoma lanceolatum TaxID=7740 RepID=A0A8J9VPP9_BRALA|nr:Hypp5463 [Branchiostoma lanceolatum]